MKMTKLDQLKNMVVKWRRDHDARDAVRIAEFLDRNLDTYIPSEKPELISENDGVKVYKIGDRATLFKREGA